VALYNTTFVIVNNSGYTLTLDKSLSENLGGADWPSSIAPHTTAASFQQSGQTNVNPTAVYLVNDSSPSSSIQLHFYCWGLDPLLHVNMTMTFSGQPFPGSSIAENQSHTNQSTSTFTAQGDGSYRAEIETTDNGASNGTATFTIG